MSETFLNDRITLHCGDCLKILATLPENSFDSCTTDPPYHLNSIVKRFQKTGGADRAVSRAQPYGRHARGFMGKLWDGGDIAFRVETWAAVYRVLKPGAYLVAFGGTRTGHRVACAIEDAGFIIHPFIAWMFGQGFPKAHRVIASGLTDRDRATEGWDGWRYGTQSMKPGIEPIYVAQKPFEDGLTGTQNVVKWGVGALNIDACRIAVEDAAYADNCSGDRGHADNRSRDMEFALGCGRADKAGRWPANVITDGSDEAAIGFPANLKSGAEVSRSPATAAGYRPNAFGAESRPSGVTTEWYGDEGSAARYFYAAKADSDDRLGSKHPTVKPLDLMQYLVRLVTPPLGLVLDPFAGTGTTGEAAWREGFSAVLIEAETEYQADIRRRMALVLSGPDERARESIKAKTKDKPPNHGPLFGDE